MASPNDYTPSGDGVQGTQRDKLHVVVGWLPRSPGGSLAQGAKALAPAVLYGDSVTVICPQSDDALETQDYFDLRDAVPGAVKFDALDSRYAALDSSGQPLANENGEYLWQPYAPAVWSHLVEVYLDNARQAWAGGGNQQALESVARCAVMLGWKYQPDDELVAAFCAELPDIPREDLQGAVAARREFRDDVVGAWLLGAFVDVGSEIGRYLLLDDPAGLLSRDALTRASSGLDRYTRLRGAEAALSAAVLRTLPSPDVSADWSELADIRKNLQVPLRRFRVAIAELSIGASTDQLSPDFDDVADQILRTKVWPALHELEELIREGSIRSVFFRDVTGDLSAYAGPLLGLATAASGALPNLVSAALGAVTPIASSVSHVRQKREAIRRHEFFFVREAERRLRRG